MTCSKVLLGHPYYQATFYVVSNFDHPHNMSNTNSHASVVPTIVLCVVRSKGTKIL